MVLPCLLGAVSWRQDVCEEECGAETFRGEFPGDVLEFLSLQILTFCVHSLLNVVVLVTGDTQRSVSFKCTIHS